MIDPLVVDVSPYQVFPASRWADLAAAGPPWLGGGVKVSEGRSGYPAWLAQHWSAIRAAGLVRLGYHFWRRDVPGTEQAHVMLLEIERAGGLAPDDILVVDVEVSEANRGASAAEVVASVSALVAALKAETCRGVVLYGGQWLAELGVTDRMRCAALWYPSYTAHLDQHAYERIEWTRDRLAMWQYAGLRGDGRIMSALAGYPTQTPIGPADISALVMPGGIARLQELLSAEKPD